MNVNAMQALDYELQNICSGLVSEGTPMRNKAFQALQDILNNRENDIHEMSDCPNYSSSMSWTHLWTSTLDGITYHVEKILSTQNNNSLKSKCFLYGNVTVKLVSTSNHKSDNISKKLIIEKCIEILNHSDAMQQYFGSSLLQILETNVLLSRTVWKDVSCKIFGPMINLLVNFLQTKTIPDHIVLNTLLLVVKSGIEKLHIGDILASQLSKLKTLFKTERREDFKIILLKVICLIVFEIVPDHPKVVSEYLYDISIDIFKTYGASSLRDEQKVSLFKLLDLTVVLCNPCFGLETLDEEKWHKLLKNLVVVVIEKEISNLDRKNTAYLQGIVIDPVFIELSARVCALAFWQPEVWQQKSENEQVQKRPRHIEKIEALLDRVERNQEVQRYGQEYSWRWLLVLAKILKNHPNIITGKI